MQKGSFEGAVFLSPAERSGPPFLFFPLFPTVFFFFLSTGSVFLSKKDVNPCFPPSCQPTEEVERRRASFFLFSPTVLFSCSFTAGRPSTIAAPRSSRHRDEERHDASFSFSLFSPDRQIVRTSTAPLFPLSFSVKKLQLPDFVELSSLLAVACTSPTPPPSSLSRLKVRRRFSLSPFFLFFPPP